MKLNGNILEARYEKKIAFKREPENIVFTLRSVKDTSEFESICPPPEVGYITKPGVGSVPDTESTKYQEAMEEWGARKVHYMSIKTIQDVEWDTVKIEDPETWQNWSDDLDNAGFTTIEVLRLQTAIFEVNGLTEDSVEDAEKN